MGHIDPPDQMMVWVKPRWSLHILSFYDFYYVTTCILNPLKEKELDLDNHAPLPGGLMLINDALIHQGAPPYSGWTLSSEYSWWCMILFVKHMSDLRTVGDILSPKPKPICRRRVRTPEDASLQGQ